MQKQQNNLKEDFRYIENLIVKNCLENEQFLSATIKYLKPELFTDNDNKKIVQLLTVYFSKVGKLPSQTELRVFLHTDKLKDSYQKVLTATANVGEIDYDELLQHAEKFLKIQSFEKVLLDIAADWDKVIESRDGVVSCYNELESIVSYNLKTTEGHNFFDSVDDYLSELVQEQNCISTGLPWLDQKLNGGFLENGRSLYIFAGETNVGKSIFLHNVAVNAMKQNKKVLLFSLEMSEHMYTNRVTSTLAQLDINNLKSEAPNIKLGVQSFRDKHPGSGLLVKEYPPNSVTAATLRNYVKHVSTVESFKPDIIVIDYLNLLTADGDNSYSRVKIISEQIRAMSYEFNCPVVTATQLNRQAMAGVGSQSQAQMYDKRGPGMGTISESYGTGATADAVFSLFRTDLDKEDNAIHVGMMKNRFGENTGTTRLGIDYRTMTLFEDQALNENDDIADIDDSAGQYAV